MDSNHQHFIVPDPSLGYHPKGLSHIFTIPFINYPEYRFSAFGYQARSKKHPTLSCRFLELGFLGVGLSNNGWDSVSFDFLPALQETKNVKTFKYKNIINN